MKSEKKEFQKAEVEVIRFEKTDIHTAQDAFVDFLKTCNKMPADFDKPGQAKVIVPSAQEPVRTVSSQNPAYRPRVTTGVIPKDAIPVPTVVQAAGSAKTPGRSFRVNVNGEDYDVTVRKVKH